MYRSARDAAAAAVPKAKNDVIYDHIWSYMHIYTYFETPWVIRYFACKQFWSILDTIETFAGSFFKAPCNSIVLIWAFQKVKACYIYLNDLSFRLARRILKALSCIKQLLWLVLARLFQPFDHAGHLLWLVAMHSSARIHSSSESCAAGCGSIVVPLRCQGSMPSALQSVAQSWWNQSVMAPMKPSWKKWLTSHDCRIFQATCLVRTLH